MDEKYPSCGRKCPLPVEDVFETLEHLPSRGPFELIMAQRVLTNCEMDTRAQQLQQWATQLHEDGKLHQDILNLSRQFFALFVGSGSVLSQVKHARFLKCFQICDSTIFEECRIYVKELAQLAGL